MPPIPHRLLCSAALVTAPVCGCAQTPAPTSAPERATRAAAVGMGWSTGILGVEYVVRSIPKAPRLGAAATAGFLGPGARLTVSAVPAGSRLVPYAGSGVTTNLWGLRAGVGHTGLLDTRAIAVLEGGVQLWPARRRGVYADLGAGMALGAPHDVRLLPRVLVGGAF